MKTLVIGIGNPLRGDDGLGWRAAQALAEMPLGADVDVLACHGLTPELAERLAEAEHALFIDADARAAPGHVRCAPLVAAAAPEAFSHHLEPAALLALTQQLYGRSPKAHLISLGAADFAARDGLSPQVAAALPSLLLRVRALLGVAETGP